MNPMLDFEPAPFADLDPELMTDGELSRARRPRPPTGRGRPRPPARPTQRPTRPAPILRPPRPIATRPGSLPLLPVLPIWPVQPLVPPEYRDAPASAERTSTNQTLGSAAGASGAIPDSATTPDAPLLPTDYVRWVQQTLNQALGTRLEPDGVMGVATRSALRTFQERLGLQTTGRLGPATEAALARWHPHRPSALEPAVPGTAESEVHTNSAPATVRRGSRGAAVVLLQTKLSNHGYALATDGRFGPLTERAVLSYQRSKGLATDGIVGPLTWRSLLGEPQVPPSPPPAWGSANDSDDGSSDFRERIARVLHELPPEPGEVQSIGPTRDAFTRMTGMTQAQLLANWAKGGKMTSCNAFTGWFSVAMGSKSYLGRFDLDTFARGSWVAAFTGRLPRPGDILRFRSFHVGVCLGIRDGILYTAEGGQGGPRRGFDAIRRKSSRWDPSKFQGWVDLEGWIRGGS